MNKYAVRACIQLHFSSLSSVVSCRYVAKIWKYYEYSLYYTHFFTRHFSVMLYIFSMYVTVYIIFDSSLHICNVRNGWLCIIAVDIVLELANYNWDLLQCVNENWNWVWTWLNIISSIRAYLNNRALQSCRYSFFLLWKIIPFNRT